MQRAAALTLALCACARTSAAYKYQLSLAVPSNTEQYTVTLSEGAMFAAGAGPLGTSGWSGIELELRATVTASAPTTPYNFYVVFVDETSLSAAGAVSTSGNVEYCCSPELLKDSLCGDNPIPGGLIYTRPAAAAADSQQRIITSTVSSTGLQPTPLNVNFTATMRGRQRAILVACASPGAALPATTLAVDATFVNPYGYLPGQVFGMLPFWAVLFTGYAVLLLTLAALAACNWQHLILLQAFVVGAVLAGLAESAAYLFTYIGKNASGVPTPCSDCGPPTADFLTAIVLTVAKRAASRALLLAVALGFGVVHPRLPRRTTAFIVAAGLAYFVFGVADDLLQATTWDVSGPTMWALPVMAVDLIFLLGTWNGLTRMQRELTVAGQTHKARMYARLYAVLVASLAAWTAATVAMLVVRAGLLPVDYFALFLFSNFWDLLYFLTLVAIAVIWAPSPGARQYGYSQAASEELADEDGVVAAAAAAAAADASGAGAAPGGGGAGGAGGGAGGAAEQGVFDEEDEAGVELTLGRKGGAASASASAPTVVVGSGAVSSTAPSASGDAAVRASRVRALRSASSFNTALRSPEPSVRSADHTQFVIGEGDDEEADDVAFARGSKLVIQAGPAAGAAAAAAAAAGKQEEEEEVGAAAAIVVDAAAGGAAAAPAAGPPPRRVAPQADSAVVPSTALSAAATTTDSAADAAAARVAPKLAKPRAFAPAPAASDDDVV